MEKSKRDRKVLNPQTKELIINVVNFMKTEANGEFVVPARKVQRRTAMATGFSERTVRRIVKESKSLKGVDNLNGDDRAVTFPPRKVANRPKPKTGLDQLTKSIVRKIVHGIYVNEKTVPTIKKIHQKLVQEIDFKGSSRSAHKIVKELGFLWKKAKSKKFVLVEKHDIRLRRIQYLRNIMQYRREGRPIIYIGDTSVLSTLSSHEVTKTLGERIVLMHAGGENGFVPNALTILQTTKATGDYHQELSDHFHLWVRNILLPSFPPKTVLVINSTTYQNIQSQRIPNLDSNAEQMKQWLHFNNINFNENMLRPELHQIIKKHVSKFRKQKSIIEQLLTERGHSLLKLPSDHPDLNPIDLMWADVKNYVANRNTTFQVSSIKLLCQEYLRELEPETWLMRCDLVKNFEQQYLKSESTIDSEVEKAMTKHPLSRDGSPAKNVPDLINSETIDPEPENINYVKHVMTGLLGFEEYRVFSN